MNSFYTPEELHTLGFAQIGEDIFISRKASIYNPENMVIGNHVRIDDFCILSGKILLGSYIHISAYAALYGGRAGIICEDYATISSRNVIYAESDDYLGGGMTNPMIPDEFRNVYTGRVLVEKYAIIGSGCTLLPGVIIGEGASVGAMSLVNRDLESWTVNAGIPVKPIRKRSRELLEKEKLFKESREID